MLRVLVCLIACSGVAFGQCRFESLKRANTVTYRFKPSFDATGLTLHVKLSFMMGAEAQKLALPLEWAGEKLHSMSHLRVTSRDATLETFPNSAVALVHGRAKHLIVVEYDLERDWTGSFVTPLQFHAVLMPQYLEFTGSNALVRPALSDGMDETVNFDWQGLPPTWSLATSFGTSTSQASRCQTFTGPWIRVDEGLYAAGDYRIHSFKIGGQPSFLAIRGDWTFTDDEAIQNIQKAIDIVRGFWNDQQFPYYLVTVSPLDDDHGSSDGSEFTNAFWMFLPRKDRLDGLYAVLAHESFHTWNPGKMGTIPSGFDESKTNWFKEGVTEYYAQLLTYRAGLLPAVDYVHSLNFVLRRFPTSNDEYVRGRVIALWLDGTIRKESGGHKSLDDVMFDLVRQKDRPYTLERILTVIDGYLSQASQNELRVAVSRQGTVTVPYVMPVLGLCATAALGSYSTFDLGFDIDKSQMTKVVSGVVNDGPAYRAGMRNGDKLLGMSYWKNDADRQARFTIASQDKTRRITYLPQGGPEQAWQYSLSSSIGCAGTAELTQ